MSTIEIPARFVPHLKSAAIYTLAEEAGRVRDGEAAVRKAERHGHEQRIEIARDDLANVRPFLDRMIVLAEQIDALPEDQDSSLENEPELAFYVLHNMASKILGPEIAANLDYLPMADELPALSGALAWASAESVRLEAESLKTGRKAESVTV